MRELSTRALHKILHYLLFRFARTLNIDNAKGPFLVIAPHADDETLGCGAILARAYRRNIPVRVVVVTDGGLSSPPSVISRSELVALRRAETQHACSILGGKPTDITFLDFADGETTSFAENISRELTRLIRDIRPSHIFSPSLIDRHKDHETIATVIDNLIDQSIISVPVLYYPIWLSSARLLLRAFTSGAFLKLRRVPTAPYLDLKRAAMQSYKSQAPGFDPRGISALSPDFVNAFLQPYEFFFERTPRHQENA